MADWMWVINTACRHDRTIQKCLHLLMEVPIKYNIIIIIIYFTCIIQSKPHWIPLIGPASRPLPTRRLNGQTIRHGYCMCAPDSSKHHNTSTWYGIIHSVQIQVEGILVWQERNLFTGKQIRRFPLVLFIVCIHWKHQEHEVHAHLIYMHKYM